MAAHVHTGMDMSATPPDPRISVVMITRDRRERAIGTVSRLLALPERPRVIVVDNGSHDGSAQELRALGRGVEVIEARTNLGAAGRNIGVVHARTPYVAFSDDDSWWAPGALSCAADRLDREPQLGLVAARILVGAQELPDPVCAQMLALDQGHSRTGVPIVGFVACGAVVRRTAFLGVGGFDRRFGVGGEEAVVALDLLREGWRMRYMEDLVAYHHPACARDPGARRAREVRNALWSAWMRRPWPRALAMTARAFVRAAIDADVRAGALEAVIGGAWTLRSRSPIPGSIEAQVRRAECFDRDCIAAPIERPRRGSPRRDSPSRSTPANA